MTSRRYPDNLNMTPTLEQLEDRWVPATIPVLTLPGGPTLATFTDADGDTVTVRIAGTSGTAVFADAGGNPVDDGDDIASVSITGASNNFTLTYSFDASGGGGEVVAMGDVTSNRIIRGIFSVPLNNAGTPLGSFSLGSFDGPGFSNGGGLSADDVLGNVAGIGVRVTQLPDGRTINIRDAFAGDLVVTNDLGGIINVGGDVDASSQWKIRGQTATTALIGVDGAFNGEADFRGTFAGDVNINGTANGTWTFREDVLKTARLRADQFDDVNALRNWAGQLQAEVSDITLAVGGNVQGATVLTTEGELQLTVTGNVAGRATMSASSEIVATVGGNSSGVWATSSTLSLVVAGNVTRANITSEDDITLTVGGDVSGTQVAAQSDLSLQVTGTVTASSVFAGSGLTADVGGTVRNSILEGSSQDVTVVIGANLVDSRVTSGSEDLTLVVAGNMTRSSASALESDVIVTVGGNMTDSQVAADNEMTIAVTGSITDSSINGDHSGVSLTVGAGITNSSVTTASSDLVISVTGNITGSSFVATASDVTLAVTGTMTGSRVEAASDVTLTVGRSLLNSDIVGDEGSHVTVVVGRDMTGSHIRGLDQDVTVVVGRNLADSTINSTADVTVAVGGNMSNTRATSTTSDVSVIVTQSVTDSVIISSDNEASVTVGTDFLRSTVVGQSDVTLSVTGNARGAVVQSYSSDVHLTVGGTVSGRVVALDGILADVGTLDGLLQSLDLDLNVGQDVTENARIQAQNVDDLDGDTIGFKVGGTFAGVLNAVNFDSDEAVVSTLVAGAVKSTARFNISGNFGDTADEDFAFGANFKGRFNLGSSLDVDLGFAGNVNRVIIGGTVGVTGAANTIFVGGTLTYLSSNSLFDVTVPGLDGEFEDGAGVVTGLLDTGGGFVTVVPTV